LINVDAGEREFGDTLDLEFLKYVGEVNIALGGHAGTPLWSKELAKQALDVGCMVNLHPGYPDREGFGREVMDMTQLQLTDALSRQREVLSDVASCKFHGALYNQAMVDRALAELLVEWASNEGVEQLLVMPDSVLEAVAKEVGISARREGFLDRRYERKEGGLCLMSRTQDGAVFHTVDQCLSQYSGIAERSAVQLEEGEWCPISVQTCCLHGDGEVGLEVARQISGIQSEVYQERGMVFPLGDSGD